MKEQTAELYGNLVAGFVILLVVCGLVAALLMGCPRWHVYQQTMAGKAKLAEAESSREIAVVEAKAKLDSAEMLAQAEVKRAQGVAKANEIIGNSLRDNEAYLRYLWITDVAQSASNNTVIYVPTEASLPILEARRLNK